MAIAIIKKTAVAETIINGSNAATSAWLISLSPDNFLRGCTLLRGSQARTHCVQDWLRIETDPDKADHHQAKHCPFAHAHIRQFPMLRVGSLKRALRKPQSIKSGNEKTKRGDNGERNIRPVGPEQDEKFTHKISQSRKSE